MAHSLREHLWQRFSREALLKRKRKQHHRRVLALLEPIFEGCYRRMPPKGALAEAQLRTRWPKVWEVPPMFSSHSYGFRSEGGINKAMNAIARFKNVRWLTSGRLSLGRLPNTRVEERLDANRALVHGPYYNHDHDDNDDGSKPLKRLLQNIYLNEVDMFVETSLLPPANMLPAYCSVATAGVAPQMDTLEHYRTVAPSDHNFAYVRYANVVLLGGTNMTGSHGAVRRFTEFLTTDLRIWCQTSGLSLLSNNAVDFLGFVITYRPPMAMPSPFVPCMKKLIVPPKTPEWVRKDRKKSRDKVMNPEDRLAFGWSSYYGRNIT